MGHVTQARGFLQFSCHAKSNWKITAFQGFPHFRVVRYALLRSVAFKGAPRLGALTGLPTNLRSGPGPSLPRTGSRPPRGLRVPPGRSVSGSPPSTRDDWPSGRWVVRSPIARFPERLQRAATENYGKTFTLRRARPARADAAPQTKLKCAARIFSLTPGRGELLVSLCRMVNFPHLEVLRIQHSVTV
jgi:hypothetical protein